MNLEKSKLFKIYFNLLKVVLIVSAVMLIKVQLEFFFHWGSFIMSLVGLSVIALQLFAIFKAEKLIEERKYLGTVIGLVLAVLCLAGLTLPLGILGIYSLINNEYLNTFGPDDAPAWFTEVINTLKALKVRRTF